MTREGKEKKIIEISALALLIAGVGFVFNFHSPSMRAFWGLIIFAAIVEIIDQL